MKRDVELCRKIVLAIRGHEDRWLAADQLKALVLAGAGHGPRVDASLQHAAARVIHDQFVEHLVLLKEAGLIERQAGTRGSLGKARLTNSGHDFAEMASEDVVWSRAKEIATRTAGVVTLQCLVAVLSELAVSPAKDAWDQCFGGGST